MLLRWIAVCMLSGALIMPVYAAEKDAPLPFDDPSSAPQIVKKKKPAAKPRKQAKSGTSKKPKVSKTTTRPTAKKAIARKPVAKKKR